MKKSAVVAFAALGTIWGSNFIVVKWAASEISPAQITLLRVVSGFLPILAYALLKRALRWQHLRHAHHFAVMSLLATVIYYYAFTTGTAMLPSSIAGMLSGAIPLFTFICAWLFLREERIDLSKAAGVAMGLIGVLLIARPWSTSADINLVGIAYILFGSLSVGGSFVYARKFVSPLKMPAVALTTYQIGLAMLFLLAVTKLDGIEKVFDDTRAWTSLIFSLGLLGTGMAYVAYYHIVENLGAVAASSVTYIPPIVALLIGVTLVGESINAMEYLAIAFILVGVAILQFGSRLGKGRRSSNVGPVRD